MYCSKCGSEIPTDAGFCSKCGTAVVVHKLKTSTSHPDETNEESRIESRLVVISVIVGIVIVPIVVIFASLGNSQPASQSSNQAAENIITTVYTTTTANVRSCDSISCSIVGTYPPGTGVDVSSYKVTSALMLPSWVAFSYSNDDGSLATGYISKSVLTDQQITATDTEQISQAATATEQTSPPSQQTTRTQNRNINITNTSGNLTSATIAQIEPAVVEINCYSYDDSVESSGSGVSLSLRNAKGQYFIETNYHVYAGAIVNSREPAACFAVFPEPPDFTYNGRYGDYQISLYAYHNNPYTYEDVALFTLGSPLSSSTPLDKIPVVEDFTDSIGYSQGYCSDSFAEVGDNITIFGYPNSGNLLGISETVTTGIVSGILAGPIYKTNAAIDHGNSGGVAILNKKGCLLGIPTLGQSGLTAGIGYIQSYSLAATPVN